MRVKDWLETRVGHRGAFLLFLALLDELYGYSLLTFPRTGLEHFTTYAPVHWWALAWMTAGAVCGVSAFLQWDMPGFTTAAFFKAAWAALWADLWIVQGYPGGWISVTIWAGFAAFVLNAGAWPEPVMHR